MFSRILLIGLSFCVFSGLLNSVRAQDIFGDEEEVEIDPFLDEAPDWDKPGAPQAPAQTQPALDTSRGRLSPNIVPENTAEIPAQELLDLLDKAEAAFAVDREITPLEMLQSVALLLKHGNDQQTRPFVHSLLTKFLKAKVSQQELFEIADKLGASALAGILAQTSLAPLNEQAVDRILEGYYSHLNDRDAMEAALLWRDLETPLELIFAANQLSKNGRLEIAGRLLKQFLVAQATPEQLAEINQKLGTEDIIRILSEPKLQPEGQLVARRIIEGTEAFFKANPPEPVAQGLQTILDAAGSKSQIASGLSAIWRGNETSLEELVEILCITQDDEELANVESILRSFGRAGLDAVAVMLVSGNDQKVNRCAKFLYSRIPNGEAFLFYPALFDVRLDQQTKSQIAYYVEKLSGRVPTAEQAARELKKIAMEYAGKDRFFILDSENNATFWFWVFGSAGKPQLMRRDVFDAIRLKTFLFAEQAWNIAPNLNDIRTFRYAAALEIFVHDLGLDQPAATRKAQLKAMGGGLSIADLDAILNEAMRLGWTGAGIAAAELLGETDNADVVLYPNRAGRPSTLVVATQCNDRRIRFAATAAVMQLRPNRPYPGSSYVSSSLVWFAGSEGKRLAIVGCPKIADAMQLTGFLHSLGYTTKIATKNDDVLKEAVASPDVELVLIDWRLSSPQVPIFAQQMENDARSHEIPIAVISGDEATLRATPIEKPLPLMSKFERSISKTSLEHSLAVVLPHPQNRESTEFIVGRLRYLTGASEVPAEIRLEQARQSLRWLTAIVRDNPNIYRVENLEILAQYAAHSPVLAEEGLPLVAQIRSNSAQLMLVDIATLKSIPLNIRENAAEAFAENVRKHGVLIRGNQVKRLLDSLAIQYEQESPDPIYDALVKTIENRIAR
ncbi:MAG: hypothetical protein FWC43_00035 [Planctomycetaceae bacterium]|nr:hypothetical protein [Planctomycetaceae bacterium]